MDVVVTGASGFIGEHLCLRLLAQGHRVAGTCRGAAPGWPGAERVRWLPWAGQALEPGLAGVLQVADAVIHLVGRAHLPDGEAKATADHYREVNVHGTARLLEACQGLPRFLFLSSAKALGESSAPGAPFRDGQTPAPTSPYGRSKLEAERTIAAALPGRFVLLRPPLVYGPGVKANFLRLLDLVHRGVPLPLASAQNRRSLVYVRNLADALACALVHPAAAGNTFLVSDGEDLSTPDLIRRVAQALGRPARTFPCPPWFLYGCARALGRRAEAERLLGTLQLDASGLARVLGWQAPYAVDLALAETAAWFLRKRGTASG